MYINAKRKPQTVKIDMTIFNDDGSKDVITTEALDLEGADRPLSETWFRYGLTDQLDEPPVDVLKWDHSLVVSKSFFQLELCLPPHSSNKTGIVYRTQHVEAPAKNVIILVDERIYNGRPTISEYTEEYITSEPSLCRDHIYFFLDLP